MRGLAGARRLRGPVERALVALPHRHQRVPRHVAGPPAPGPADGPGAFGDDGVVRWARRSPSTRGSSPSPTRVSLPDDADPAEVAEVRESIRLAFVTALQHLPPRQRAVLILREVLRWQATEVAELLDTSVASVNSALQRARATLARRDPDASDTHPVDADQQALLARYVDAFERYDIASLVSLLHDDAIMSMPPFDFWLRGAVEMGRWFLGPGQRVPWLASHRDHRQRLYCVRLVPLRSAGRPRSLGAPGHRSLRRPDRRASQLRRHQPVRGVRPPRTPRAVARRLRSRPR